MVDALRSDPTLPRKVGLSNSLVKDEIVSVEVEGIVDLTFYLLSLEEEGLSGWEEGKSSLLKDGKIGG